MKCILISLLLLSCNNSKYQMYRCDCTQKITDTFVYYQNYGLDAKNDDEANYYCNDIQKRVQKVNISTIKCKIK